MASLNMQCRLRKINKNYSGVGSMWKQDFKRRSAMKECDEGARLRSEADGYEHVGKKVRTNLVINGLAGRTGHQGPMRTGVNTH